MRKPTQQWIDDELDALRAAGDPPADELAQVFGSQLPRLVLDLVESLGENGAPPPPGTPARLAAFLQTQGALPPWADPELIAQGQRLFCRFGPPIVLCLTCAALPECYAAARGAQILGLSQRLRRYTHRRVLETAQLVLDVMAPGGLGPDGHGVRSAQKVRLIHAIQRVHLARHPHYDPEWGLPVNQEDMLGTLMAFSSVVLEALPKLGIEPSAEEAEGYLHAWLVVGHLLGCDPSYFPSSPAEAADFAAIVRRRHHARTEAGCTMARALRELMEQAVPGTILDGFVPVLMRHLCGDRVADLLDIPREDWTRALLWPLRLSGALIDAACDVPPIGRATELLSRRFLEGMYVAEAGAQPVQFYVPPRLQSEWQLQPAPAHAPAASRPLRAYV